MKKAALITINLFMIILLSNNLSKAMDPGQAALERLKRLDKNYADYKLLFKNKAVSVKCLMIETIGNWEYSIDISEDKKYIIKRKMPYYEIRNRHYAFIRYLEKKLSDKFSIFNNDNWKDRLYNYFWFTRCKHKLLIEPLEVSVDNNNVCFKADYYLLDTNDKILINFSFTHGCNHVTESDIKGIKNVADNISSWLIKIIYNSKK